MKKTVHKVFWMWDFEKEEKWLNEMSVKGLQLCDVGFCRYTFEEGVPGEYLYRLELLEYWPSHDKSMEYIRFLEDAEVEYIGSMMRWIYSRKKAQSGVFNLFSDIHSRIKHLDRMLFLAGILLVCNLINTINSLFSWRFVYAVSIFCGIVSLLLGYGFLRLFFMRQKLKRESLLHE